MDGTQQPKDATPADADARSIHQLILDSVSRERRMGVGLQGEVYHFASKDPFFDNFLVKRIRLVGNVPGQDEASFKRKLLGSSSLMSVTSALDGHNYGQPLMVDEGRSFAILLKQRGNPLDTIIETDIPALRGKKGEEMRPEARYHLYLNWLLHDIADATLGDLGQKIRRVKDANMAIDHVKKDNIFWDAEHQQFNLIDLFDRYAFRDVFDKDKRYNALQRPVQLAYAAWQGVADPKISTREELFELLTYDMGHRFQAGGMGRTAEEKATTISLEAALKQRIDALPDTLFELPKAEAVPTVKVSAIKNIGTAHITDLKDRLDQMAAQFLR